MGTNMDGIRASDSPRMCFRCWTEVASITTMDAYGQTEWMCATCAEREAQPYYKEGSADTDFVPYEAEEQIAAYYKAMRQEETDPY